MSGFTPQAENFTDENGQKWTKCLNCNRIWNKKPKCRAKYSTGYTAHIQRPVPRKKCEEENQVLKEIQKLKEENNRLRNCIKKL